MDRRELQEIKGGASATLINAFARVIDTIVSVGQMIGSAIKRKLRGEANFNFYIYMIYLFIVGEL